MLVGGIETTMYLQDGVLRRSSIYRRQLRLYLMLAFQLQEEELPSNDLYLGL